MTTAAGTGALPPDPHAWRLPRLRITRDGEWLHDGVEITHAGILANLRESLRVDPEGHYLQVGAARVPVDLDDAPFVVLRVEREGERLVLTLNDLCREALAVDTLRFDVDAVPHCRVKDGRFAARLSRAATYQLFRHVEYDELLDEAALVLGSRRFRFRP